MTTKKAAKGKSDSPELPSELSNYLLLIHELLIEKGYVRGVELAERLQMSRPTVTRAIQRLAALGFANYERYRGITLSKVGVEAAEKTAQRYKVALDFLTSTGSPITNLPLEARRLSASSNDEVLAALKAATSKIKKG